MMGEENFNEAERIADDDVYLGEDRFDEPKEIHKFVADMIAAPRDADVTFLDVGCATGEFIYYLRKLFPRGSFTGYDVSEPMLARAREILPDTRFVMKDVLSQTVAAERVCDVVVCVGVVQIFDNIEICLHNLLRHVKPGGQLIVAGPFNANPIDMITRYRRADQEDGGWELGWNAFSRHTCDRALESSGKDLRWDWADFVMPFPLERGEDSMRTWTIGTDACPTQLVNGAGQLINIHVLSVMVS